MYLRVAVMEEYHVKFFETDNNDSRLSSIYPSFALSDFHLQCRFESLSDTPLYVANEAPPDRKLCSPQILQSRFTAFRTLIKFSRIFLMCSGPLFPSFKYCWYFLIVFSSRRCLYIKNKRRFFIKCWNVFWRCSCGNGYSVMKSKRKNIIEN